jgi:zinc transport system substrate-binding protein
LNRLIREARDKNIKSIFVQEQFDISNASQLAREIDAEIIPLNPLDPEWKEQLQTILSQLLKISADGSGS